MVDNNVQPKRQPQGGLQPLLDSESYADALISYVAENTVMVAKLLSDIIMQRSGGAMHPAWYAVNTLIHMLVPAGDPVLSLWTSCDDDADAARLRLLKEHPSILATLEDEAISKYGAVPDADNLNATIEAPNHLNLVTWNVQGIHDRQSALADLICTYDPFAMVFTETKLLPKQCRKPKSQFKRIPGGGYRVFTSCCPQENELRTMPSNPMSDDGSVLLRPRGKAGVMIAIKERWAQDHLIRKAAVPSDLVGYLLHVRIQLPASDPIHVVGVYRPNGPGSRPVHDRITNHLKGQMVAAGPRAQWLIGGDLNATQRAPDRTSLKFHPIDQQLCDDIRYLNLDSAFARPSGPTPVSFKQDRLHSDGVSSRIDDWLCVPGSTMLASVRAVPQTEVVADPELDGESDHSPVPLKVPMLRCLRAHHQPHRNQCRDLKRYAGLS